MRSGVRGVTLGLLVATAAVYAGLTIPLQKKAAATADAYRGARTTISLRLPAPRSKQRATGPWCLQE